MQYSSEKSDGYQGREFGRVGAVDIKVDISHERPVLVSILVMV